MKYRPIDTKTEKRADFKEKQVELREQDGTWIEVTCWGDTWFPGYEYREVLPDAPCDCTKLREALIECSKFAATVFYGQSSHVKRIIAEALATPCESETNLKQKHAWVPVTTPPTEQDADDDGFVRWLFADGTRSHRPWDKEWKDYNYSPPTHWHPLPKLPSQSSEIANPLIATLTALLEGKINQTDEACIKSAVRSALQAVTDRQQKA